MPRLRKKYTHDFQPALYAYSEVENTETQFRYMILCDYRGIFSVPRKEVKAFALALLEGLANISDEEFLSLDKAAVLANAPGMFPQIYGENDPLWHKYLVAHPSTPAESPRSKKSRNVAGYVYIAQMGEYFKIGCSKTPGKRVVTLGVKTPVPLRLLFVIAAEDMYVLEQALHARFVDYRADGEWFILPPDALLALQREYAAEMQP